MECGCRVRSRVAAGPHHACGSPAAALWREGEGGAAARGQDEARSAADERGTRAAALLHRRAAEAGLLLLLHAQRVRWTGELMPLLLLLLRLLLLLLHLRLLLRHGCHHHLHLHGVELRRLWLPLHSSVHSSLLRKLLLRSLLLLCLHEVLLSLLLSHGGDEPLIEAAGGHGLQLILELHLLQLRREGGRQVGELLLSIELILLRLLLLEREHGLLQKRGILRRLLLLLRRKQARLASLHREQTSRGRQIQRCRRSTSGETVWSSSACSHASERGRQARVWQERSLLLLRREGLLSQNRIERHRLTRLLLLLLLSLLSVAS